MRDLDDIIADYLSGEPLAAGEEDALASWEAREGKKLLACWSRLRLGATARARYLKARELPFRRARAVAASRRARKRRVAWGSSVAAGVLLAWGVTALVPGDAGFPAPPPGEPARIVPGSPKAELKRGDGTRVILLPGAASTVHADSLVEIKNDENTLTYTGRQATGTSARDTLLVPPGGEYTLVLADGTRVYLNSSTGLSYPVPFADDRREVYLRGEAYFEVSADGARPFVVRTDEVAVEALGTSFNVNAYATRRVATTLVSGRVRVSGGGEAREARPGQQVIYHGEGRRVETREVATELYTSWKDGYYIFRETPLEEIMTTLASWYNVNVLYANDRVKGTRFTGRLQRFEEILYLLEKFEETGTIVVTVSGNDVILDKR
jgi:ferric-dicitrate binding protein FerR (iron transport regulator)